MKNPWAKKNPLMSIWLSAANRSAGMARGVASASAKRHTSSAQANLAEQMVEIWTGVKPKTKRKSKAPSKRK